MPKGPVENKGPRFHGLWSLSVPSFRHVLFYIPDPSVSSVRPWIFIVQAHARVTLDRRRSGLHRRWGLQITMFKTLFFQMWGPLFWDLYSGMFCRGAKIMVTSHSLLWQYPTQVAGNQKNNVFGDLYFVLHTLFKTWFRQCFTHCLKHGFSTSHLSPPPLAN